MVLFPINLLMKSEDKRIVETDETNKEMKYSIFLSHFSEQTYTNHDDSSGILLVPICFFIIRQ